MEGIWIQIDSKSSLIIITLTNFRRETNSSVECFTEADHMKKNMSRLSLVYEPLTLNNLSTRRRKEEWKHYNHDNNNKTQ